MFKKFLFSFFIFFLLTTSVFAYNQNTETIKVGISNNNFSTYLHEEAEFYTTGSMSVYDSSDNTFIESITLEETLKVVCDEDGFTLYKNNHKIAKNINSAVILQNNYGQIGIKNLKRAGKDAIYRGNINLVKSLKNNNTFNIVNVVKLEEYLKGVVPNEMPVFFGIEALKAQAVAARNYAIRPRVTASSVYDICDSVACQVYFGANTEQRQANMAIEQTKNVVAMYNSEPILSLYSSTAGGYTENYENVFLSSNEKYPTKPVPYLVGKPDKYDMEPVDSEKKAEEFYMGTPATFDNASPLFRWTKSWEKSELEDILKKRLVKYSSSGLVTPKLASENDFGSLKDLKVTKRGVSGKIISMDIVTDKGTFTVKKELLIRQIFIKNGSGLSSGNVVFKINKNDDDEIQTIDAYGGGLGHGVGMSQYGAGAMGKQGFSYDKILKHYYTGIHLTTIPVILNQNENSVAQSFYANTNNALLNITCESNGIPKIVMEINGHQLLLNANYYGKSIKYNIGKYLIKGENTVYFAFSNDYGNKKTKLYIELDEAGCE